MLVYQLGTPLIRTFDGFSTCEFGFVIDVVPWNNKHLYTVEWTVRGRDYKYDVSEIQSYHCNYLHYKKNFL